MLPECKRTSNWKEGKPISRTHILRHKDLPFMEIKSGADEAYSVRKHSHTELSFGFVEHGSSKILCQPLEFDLKVNDAILIPPEIIHLCQPRDANKFRFKMLFADPE
jgi:mannose-6-phosphate isomerase-like protein (cupin superfamily)